MANDNHRSSMPKVQRENASTRLDASGAARTHLAVNMKLPTPSARTTTLQMLNFDGNCLHDVSEFGFMLFCLQYGDV
jgi:hypothetical protein